MSRHPVDDRSRELVLLLGSQESHLEGVVCVVDQALGDASDAKVCDEAIELRALMLAKAVRQLWLFGRLRRVLRQVAGEGEAFTTPAGLRNQASYLLEDLDAIEAGKGDAILRMGVRT